MEANTLFLVQELWREVLAINEQVRLRQVCKGWNQPVQRIVISPMKVIIDGEVVFVARCGEVELLDTLTKKQKEFILHGIREVKLLQMLFLWIELIAGNAPWLATLTTLSLTSGYNGNASKYDWASFFKRLELHYQLPHLSKLFSRTKKLAALEVSASCESPEAIFECCPKANAKPTESTEVTRISNACGEKCRDCKRCPLCLYFW